jgi:hypothetical protein
LTGWVYDYGLHLLDNRVSYPKMVQVETAAVSEKIVIDQQADQVIQDFDSATVTTDNSYAQAMRIRQWALIMLDKPGNRSNTIENTGLAIKSDHRRFVHPTRGTCSDGRLRPDTRVPMSCGPV